MAMPASRSTQKSTLSRFAIALLPVLLLTGLAACQGSMQERYAKVRSACRAGNKEEAARLTEELRASDAKFNRKFVYVLNKVGVSKTDYCDPLLITAMEKEMTNREDRNQ